MHLIFLFSLVNKNYIVAGFAASLTGAAIGKAAFNKPFAGAVIGGALAILIVYQWTKAWGN